MIWDNGEDLDDEQVPVRIRSLTKHMMAEGLLTGPDELGRYSLTAKGHEFADKAIKEEEEAAKRAAVKLDVFVCEETRKYRIHPTGTSTIPKPQGPRPTG